MSHEALSPQQFAAVYRPSGYGATWDEVGEHADITRPEQPGLEEDIRRHGIHEPVSVWEPGETVTGGEYRGYVVEGHHRVTAALRTGRPIPHQPVSSDSVITH